LEGGKARLSYVNTIDIQGIPPRDIPDSKLHYVGTSAFVEGQPFTVRSVNTTMQADFTPIPAVAQDALGAYRAHFYGGANTGNMNWTNVVLNCWLNPVNKE
jgi:hypothetical protein